MKNYFSHDYNARNDRKLVNLSMKHGMAGIGLYWCIAEMLYEENGEISMSECERIAYELRVDKDLILSLLGDFDLFKIRDGKFYSETIAHRLFIRNEKSNKARESASARWGNDDDAIASDSQSDVDASKGKERKGNKKKEKESKETPPLNSLEVELSTLLFQLICHNQETHKFNKFTLHQKEEQILKFAKDADAILRIDKRDPEHFRFLIQWCQQDNFWQSNILSMAKLREKFDTITAQAKRDYNQRKQKSSKNEIL